MKDLEPGFHRRIKLYPSPGRIVAALEDNLHRFAMEISHAKGVVTGAILEAERYPWTTCSQAPAFLSQQLLDRALDEVAGLNGLKHCTHLFELAILCASHAEDRTPIQFDVHVDDWQSGRTRVALFTNETPLLALNVAGRIVDTPGEWFGRDLFETRGWRERLDAVGREQAMLIARAIYVSLGRAAPVVDRAAERGASVLGVCFTYQPARVNDAVRMQHSRREFDTGFGNILQDFAPEKGQGTVPLRAGPTAGR